MSTETQSAAIPSNTAKPRRWLIGLFVFFVLVFSTIPIRNYLHGGSTKDYPLWFNTGTRMLQNRSVYYIDPHGEFPFMYPPGAAGLLALISPMGRLSMMLLLVMANSLAWWVCIAGSVYLVSGYVQGQDARLYWAASLICVPFIVATYLEGQVAMLLSACLIAMLVCLRKKWEWRAGAFLGIAVAIKGFPICAICYLIYRRHWMAVVSTIGVVCVLIATLPMFFRGHDFAIDDLLMWNHGMGASYTPDMIGQRKERSYTWQNGSLIAVTNRLLRHVDADHDDGHPPTYLNFASLSFRQVNIVITIEALGLCLIYLALMPRQSQRTAWTDTLEGGLLLILVIMFSPLSFTYNNSWLMLPITSVIYFILKLARTRQERIIAGCWLGLGVVLLMVGVRVPGLRTMRDIGNTFFADLVIFAELAWLMVKARGALENPNSETRIPESMTNARMTNEERE
jgi:Glycosyltransferase family 87